MTVYLNYGVEVESNELVFIEDVDSGKTFLKCPFCNGPLVAKKGAIMQHHFSHQSNTTCLSEYKTEIASIPFFDTFNVLDALELRVVERLYLYGFPKMYRFDGDIDAISRLAAMKIVTKVSNYKDSAVKAMAKLEAISEEYISKDGGGLSILGESIVKALMPVIKADISTEFRQVLTDVQLTESFMKNISVKKQYRYSRGGFELFDDCFYNKSIKEISETQLYWFSVKMLKEEYLAKNSLLYRSVDDLIFLKEKFSLINKQKLYVMKFTGQFFNEVGSKSGSAVKIGMTSRSAEHRRTEILIELNNKHGQGIECEVLYEKDGLGRIERLLHQKYLSQRLEIGAYREFFSSSIEKELMADLKDL